MLEACLKPITCKLLQPDHLKRKCSINFDASFRSKCAVLFKCGVCVGGGQDVIDFPDSTELAPKDVNDLVTFLRKHGHYRVK